MTIFCEKCQRWGHAEAWHSFAYRRWWVKHLKSMGKPVEQVKYGP